MPTAAARTVSVKLDDEMRDRIKHLTAIHHRTAHWVIREAIQQYVEREEKREASRQATLAAWEEYKKTGVSVAADEVVAWLETWGEANEQPAHKIRKRDSRQRRRAN